MIKRRSEIKRDWSRDGYYFTAPWLPVAQPCQCNGCITTGACDFIKPGPVRFRSDEARDAYDRRHLAA